MITDNVTYVPLEDFYKNVYRRRWHRLMRPHAMKRTYMRQRIEIVEKCSMPRTTTIANY